MDFIFVGSAFGFFIVWRSSSAYANGSRSVSMATIHVIAAVVAVLLFVYLTLAMLCPEKF